MYGAGGGGDVTLCGVSCSEGLGRNPLSIVRAEQRVGEQLSTRGQREGIAHRNRSFQQAAAADLHTTALPASNAPDVSHKCRYKQILGETTTHASGQEVNQHSLVPQRTSTSKVDTTVSLNSSHSPPPSLGRM